MPIYEYICSNCGHQLERLQKMSAAPLTKCPACGQETLNRKISASAFKLTGEGWYVTDFKDKKKTESKTDTGSKDKD